MEEKDLELRFSGTESGTSLITGGQMSSVLTVSSVAAGAAFPPVLTPAPSLLVLSFQVPPCFMNLIKGH